ncbi:YolD-like family protein [Macrococcoides caseolyticum]|uniref:YolD-like family protein n=1 Tax=Macrococcoides caseolyticum TaxID=69966 RepID=UPI001F2E782A|nr:YolD-like family protein [Macrococcus caseolyticus]MCE4957440.1 YolD-like family protein [Macrococcus caseolyticus]
MIHPIYGETDYRKVDKQLLNRNIPKGRGMIKWAPFATMPQQFEDVRRQIENQNKIARPELSEDRLQEINETLHIALALHHDVTIEYYLDGYIQSVRMTLEKIDQWSALIIGTIEHSNQTCFISFLDVINIYAH